jgi:hypothetical protein
LSHPGGLSLASGNSSQGFIGKIDRLRGADARLYELERMLVVGDDGGVLGHAGDFFRVKAICRLCVAEGLMSNVSPDTGNIKPVAINGLTPALMSKMKTICVFNVIFDKQTVCPSYGSWANWSKNLSSQELRESDAISLRAGSWQLTRNKDFLDCGIDKSSWEDAVVFP